MTVSITSSHKIDLNLLPQRAESINYTCKLIIKSAQRLLWTVDGRLCHGRFGLGHFSLGCSGHGGFGQAIFKGGRFGEI